MVEEAHAQECTYGTADPGPEEEGPLGHSALVLFRARLVISIQDERCEINYDKPVNENHDMSSETPIIELPVRFCRFLWFYAIDFRQNP